MSWWLIAAGCGWTAVSYLLGWHVGYGRATYELIMRGDKLRKEKQL